MTRKRSNWWFLLPIFLGLIGGIIGYFAIRRDDPSKGKNVFYLGLILFVIGTIVNIAQGFDVMSTISPFSLLT